LIEKLLIFKLKFPRLNFISAFIKIYRNKKVVSDTLDFKNGVIEI